MEIWNLYDLPPGCEERHPDGGSTRYLGQAAGSMRLYANVDTIPSGCYSTKYHSHTLQEEFFLVMSGTGVLRTPEGEQPVHSGDFYAKPSGPEHAHTFYNPGPEPLVILDTGTVQKGDICIYPDEDAYYLRDNHLTFQGKDQVKGWNSAPK